MALIDLNGITRSVVLPDGSDLHILRGVDLSVEAGEHLSIVGRSGTGKSTLLNLIGLLDRPNSGTYLIDGKDALRLREGRRARLRGDTFGFVFQQFNIFNARTALENVEVPLLYASGSLFWKRKALCAQMLERVGLGDRLDSYPTDMSGGEQQRIAIARALVRRPRIILADEPTGALDPDTGRLVMSLLEEVAAENNAALIVITHDFNVAARAHRVLSVSEGVLHEVDPSQTLTPSAAANISDGVIPHAGPSAGRENGAGGSSRAATSAAAATAPTPAVAIPEAGGAETAESSVSARTLASSPTTSTQPPEDNTVQRATPGRRRTGRDQRAASRIPEVRQGDQRDSRLEPDPNTHGIPTERGHK